MFAIIDDIASFLEATVLIRWSNAGLACAIGFASYLDASTDIWGNEFEESFGASEDRPRSQTAYRTGSTDLALSAASSTRMRHIRSAPLARDHVTAIPTSWNAIGNSAISQATIR